MFETNIHTPTVDLKSAGPVSGTEDSARARGGEPFADYPGFTTQTQSGTGRPRRKLTKAELISTIRLNLSAEQEVVHLYLASADLTDDPLVEQVLRDIADEESAHIAEFARLIGILAPEEGALMEVRARRVDALRCAPAAVRRVSTETRALPQHHDMQGA